MKYLLKNEKQIVTVAAAAASQYELFAINQQIICWFYFIHLLVRSASEWTEHIMGFVFIFKDSFFVCLSNFRKKSFHRKKVFCITPQYFFFLTNNYGFFLLVMAKVAKLNLQKQRTGKNDAA